MNICMLVTTSVLNDPRVMREATALVEAGCQMKVIGVRRLGTEPIIEIVNGIYIHRLELWHISLVRWIKSRKGLSPTEGMLSSTKSRSTKSLYSSFQNLARNIIYQIQDVIHLLTVLYAFILAARHCSADVYHAHDADTLLPAVILGLIRRKRIVYDAHEYWQGQTGRLLSHAIIHWIESFGISHSDHILTVNNSIAEKISKDHNQPFPTVIMNVPDHTSTTEPFPKQESQPLELLFHGFFQSKRGIDILISSIAYVKSPVRLTLRGYGEKTLSLKNQVSSLDLENKIFFLPVVPMNQIIPSSIGYHIGVLPFERDSPFYFSLPNKLFEYMAAGLAILTNNLIEIAAIVNENHIGVVYNSEDPVIIAQAIDKLASDRELLECYRIRAWQVFNKQYSWHHHKKVLTDVYEGLQ